MSTARALAPKQPWNLVLTGASCLALVAAWAVAVWLAPFSPKRGVGLVLGMLAALLFVFEMLYPARRPRARPLGTARRWLQAHVYLGAVAFVAVWAHAGFGLPHGGIGWWLFLLALWTTLTGLLGVWLQKAVPATLAQGLRVEALYERIPELVNALVVEADTLVAERGEALEGFYRREVRPELARLKPSWSYLSDVRAGRERALEPFRRMRGFVSEEEQAAVADLEAIYTDKLELDAQYSLQGLLRGWLALHAPPAGLLMGLVVVHVFTWLWY